MNDKNILNEDIKKRTSKLDYSELQKRYNSALKVIDELEKEKTSILSIKEANITPIEIKGDKNLKSEATAFVLASDWHVGTRVVGSRVNGLNIFNERIADLRINNFFVNVATLLKMFSRDVTIKNVVLALIGDFITNSIHEELLENNTMRPMDELIFVQDRIVAGIKYLLKHTDKNLIIPCVSGNHGRATKKVHISTEQGNSLEYYMYCNLRSLFKDEKRVTFLISDGQLLYLKVYGKTIRFLHGHNLKFGQGIGGIFIPAYKAISQWDKSKKADITCFGHFHSTKDGGNFLCNGSLVGYDEYALSIKADFEDPKQTFFLVDKLRGRTITAPIMLNSN